MPTFTDHLTDPQNPTVVENSVIGNDILFQGRRYDKETNLMYFRARYYCPIMGRFLQTDPKGYRDSMNLYQAFNMNPNNFLDPMGKNWEFDSFEENKMQENIFALESKILEMATIHIHHPKALSELKRLLEVYKDVRRAYGRNYDFPLSPIIDQLKVTDIDPAFVNTLKKYVDPMYYSLIPFAWWGWHMSGASDFTMWVTEYDFWEGKKASLPTWKKGVIVTSIVTAGYLRMVAKAEKFMKIFSKLGDKINKVTKYSKRIKLITDKLSKSRTMTSFREMVEHSPDIVKKFVFSPNITKSEFMQFISHLVQHGISKVPSLPVYLEEFKWIYWGAVVGEMISWGENIPFIGPYIKDIIGGE